MKHFDRLIEVFNSGKYYATEDGKIYSTAWGYTIQRKPTISRKGYYYINLSDNNKKVFRVAFHQFIWVFFKRTFDQSKQINHIDYNKTNNAISNLELITPKENIDHAKLHGKYNNPLKGEIHGMAKLKEKQVIDIRNLVKNGKTRTEVAKIYGVSTILISKIYNRKLWVHI